MATAQRLATLSALRSMAACGPALVRNVHLLRQTETQEVRWAAGGPPRGLRDPGAAPPEAVGLGDRTGLVGRKELTGKRG